MKKIRLVDGSFLTAKSATLAGDNLGHGPKHFEWIRDDNQSGVTFFTDICLEQALDDKSPKKVAWLIEPPEVSNKHYEFVLKNRYQFDLILTWSNDFFKQLESTFEPQSQPRAGGQAWYPFGGSWIRDWQLYPKSKLCSIIVSEKDQTEGQKLRHEIVKRFDNGVDVYGTGYNPIESKLEALKDYQYSIVVENVKSDYWFTEKLIDCFATGTIPIYWGCPSIGKFTGQGIIRFDIIEDLETIWPNLDIGVAGNYYSVSMHNFEQAQKYRCTEDWLYKHYPFLFEV